MLIPSTFPNGILITIIGLVISIPFFIWAFILYRRQQTDGYSSRLRQNGITRAYIVVSHRDYRFETDENGSLQLLFLPRIEANPAVRVEDIKVEINGERHPTDWQPMDESRAGEIGCYTYTDVLKIKPGVYQARIIAIINNMEHPSDLFTVDYRQSTLGKPNYQH